MFRKVLLVVILTGLHYVGICDARSPSANEEAVENVMRYPEQEGALTKASTGKDIGAWYEAEATPNLRGMGLRREADLKTSSAWPIDMDDDVDDPPEIWDVIIWVGVMIGRATRTILMFAGRIAHAIWSGITRGWEKHSETTNGGKSY